MSIAYDFLVTPDDPPPTIGVPVELPKHLGKFTPKMFLKDVGSAYKELGGLTWLVAQATAAPVEFLKLLQKMIPKTVDLDLMEGTTITLIDQFSGQSVKIAGPSRSDELSGSPATRDSHPLLPDGPAKPVEVGHSEIDTSGSPEPTSGGSPPSEVAITDTYLEQQEVIDV